MAMTKEGSKMKEVKGQKAFSTGYIAPTMEVITIPKTYFGGLMSNENEGDDVYRWIQYKKKELTKEINGKLKKKTVPDDIEEIEQSLDGGLFLFRDKRTDEAYIIDSNGNLIKKRG